MAIRPPRWRKDHRTAFKLINLEPLSSSTSEYFSLFCLKSKNDRSLGMKTVAEWQIPTAKAKIDAAHKPHKEHSNEKNWRFWRTDD